MRISAGTSAASVPHAVRTTSRRHQTVLSTAASRLTGLGEHFAEPCPFIKDYIPHMGLGWSPHLRMASSICLGPTGEMVGKAAYLITSRRCTTVSGTHQLELPMKTNLRELQGWNLTAVFPSSLIELNSSDGCTRLLRLHR